MAEFDTPQICDCGTSDLSKRIIASSVGFVLKGDGWTGKNIKIKGQMARRRQTLEGKERERKMDGPSIHLAPNVGGERVESWADAQRLAKSKGKDASSYDAVVRKERQEGRR